MLSALALPCLCVSYSSIPFSLFFFLFLLQPTLLSLPSDFLLFSAEQTQLEHVEVDYVTLPGWKTSTSGVKKFSDLPPNAQTYVKKLEELLEVPSK